MNIGQIRKELENVNRDKLVIVEWFWKDEKRNAFPHYIDSWRGKYSEASINLSHVEKCTVENFIDMLDFSLVNVYEGYKGGEFEFSEETPLRIDNYGIYTPQEEIQIEIGEEVKIIHTLKNE